VIILQFTKDWDRNKKYNLLQFVKIGIEIRGNNLLQFVKIGIEIINIIYSNCERLG
jgi:hypothetical protein